MSDLAEEEEEKTSGCLHFVTLPPPAAADRDDDADGKRGELAGCKSHKDGKRNVQRLGNFGGKERDKDRLKPSTQHR